MEQRWTTRTPACLSVDLRYQDIEIADCQTQDISLGGAYIKVQQLQQAVNHPIELVFKFKDNGESTKYRMPAKVVRSESGGIGVMFKDIDISAFRALREILRHKEMATLSG